MNKIINMLIRHKISSYHFAAFVFLALLEFTVVNYLWRKENYKPNFRRCRSGIPTPDMKNQAEIEGYDQTPSPGNTSVQVS